MSFPRRRGDRPTARDPLRRASLRSVQAHRRPYQETASRKCAANRKRSRQARRHRREGWRRLPSRSPREWPKYRPRAPRSVAATRDSAACREAKSRPAPRRTRLQSATIGRKAPAGATRAGSTSRPSATASLVTCRNIGGPERSLRRFALLGEMRDGRPAFFKLRHFFIGLSRRAAQPQRLAEGPAGGSDQRHESETQGGAGQQDTRPGLEQRQPPVDAHRRQHGGQQRGRGQERGAKQRQYGLPAPDPAAACGS